jgi:hypothetical protein
LMLDALPCKAINDALDAEAALCRAF